MLIDGKPPLPPPPEPPAPMPTHAERIDVLEIHCAHLLVERAQRALDDARARLGELIASAANKYAFDPSAGEGVRFDTGEIVRQGPMRTMIPDRPPPTRIPGEGRPEGSR